MSSAVVSQDASPPIIDATPPIADATHPIADATPPPTEDPDAPLVDPTMSEYEFDVLDQAGAQPPDGGFSAWLIVAATFMMNLMMDGVVSTFSLLLPHIVESFHKSDPSSSIGLSEVAWAGSLLNGLSLCIGPLVGVATNKYGCRTVAIAGAIVSCIGFLGASFSTNLPTLLLTFGALGGIGFGMCYLPAVVIVGMYFAKKRATATGVSISGSGCGSASFVPAIAQFMKWYGLTWQNICLIFALMMLLMVLCGLTMKPLKQPPVKMLKEVNILEDPTQPRRPTLMAFGPTMPPIPGPSTSAQASAASAQMLFTIERPGTSSAPVLPANQTDSTSDNTENSDIEGFMFGGVQPSVHNNAGQAASSTLPLAYSVHAAHAGTANATSVIQLAFDNETAANVPNASHAPASMTSVTENPGNANILQNSSHGINNVNSASNSTIEVNRQDSGTDQNTQLIRPFSKQDIFYPGNTTNLEQKPKSELSLDSHESNLISLKRAKKHRAPDVRKRQLRVYFRSPCKRIKKAFGRIIDFHVVSNPLFLAIALSGLVGMLGHYVPSVYCIDLGTSLGFSKTASSVFVSCLGLTSWIGRLFFGWFVDRKGMSATVTFNTCIMVMSVSVTVLPFLGQIENSGVRFGCAAAAFAVTGLCISGVVCLTSIVLVNTLGIEYLTGSLGLLMLFRGVPAVLGAPLAGVIYDLSEPRSFIPPFVAAGGFLFISGLISIIIPQFVHMRSRKRKKPVYEELVKILEKLEGPQEQGATSSEANM